MCEALTLRPSLSLPISAPFFTRDKSEQRSTDIPSSSSLNRQRRTTEDAKSYFGKERYFAEEEFLYVERKLPIASEKSTAVNHRIVVQHHKDFDQ